MFQGDAGPSLPGLPPPIQDQAATGSPPCLHPPDPVQRTDVSKGKSIEILKLY